jgi:D-xylose transport system substrate-binding protein
LINLHLLAGREASPVSSFPAPKQSPRPPAADANRSTNPLIIKVQMKTKIIITVLLIAVILASCEPVDKVVPTESKTDILVGITGFSNQKKLWNNLTTLLEEKGYKVIYSEDFQNAEQQNSQIDHLVAEGVKILIIPPIDSNVAVSAVDRAAMAGVKVIAWESLIKTPHIAAYLSFENIEIGRQQAQGILKALDIDHWDVAKNGPVQLVELGGAENDNNSYMFRKGQDEVLAPYVENGLVQVIANPWVENWDPANAASIMEELLVSQNNRIDAVVASNDGTALGALQALNAHQKKIPISGQDATVEGCASIVQGQLTLTILKDSSKLIALTVDVVDKLAKGDENPDLHKMSLVELTGNDMLAGDVYVAFLPFQLITKDNLYDLVVKTGFQPYDDVYKDVPENQRPPRP